MDEKKVRSAVLDLEDILRKAEELQRKGFYALPVRPPTVPEGTSRIRFSLTAEIRESEMEKLINEISKDEKPV